MKNKNDGMIIVHTAGKEQFRLGLLFNGGYFNSGICLSKDILVAALSEQRVMDFLKDEFERMLLRIGDDMFKTMGDITPAATAKCPKCGVFNELKAGACVCGYPLTLTADGKGFV